jgi:AcrR family transcriptional regulator
MTDDPTQNLSRAKRQRRERILDAAELAFRSEGFRGATMERIAEAAGMSKVTVYGYFPDKEAAFRAVAQRFAIRLAQVFDDALRAPGRLVERISNALIAKHAAVRETVRRSAAAPDIFAASDRIASEIFLDLDRALTEQIVDALAREGAEEPERVGRLLFDATSGIARHGPVTSDLGADIALLVSAMLHRTAAGP